MLSAPSDGVGDGSDVGAALALGSSQTPVYPTRPRGFWQRILALLRLVEPTRHPDTDPVFAAAVIALAAKLARVDGVVLPEEQAAFRMALQADPHSQRQVDHLFDLAQQTSRGFEGYAHKLAKRYCGQPSILEDVLDVLFFIAKADGHLSRSEHEYLQAVAEAFGFHGHEFARIRASHVGWGADDPTDHPYVILGISPDASDEDLRRAWRHALVANHPDKAMARGFAGAFVAMSGQKTAAINAAYQAIRAERGQGRTA